MRIAYDHQIFGLQTYGGISRYFVRLAQEIYYAQRHSVRIFAPWHVNHYLHSSSPPLTTGRKLEYCPKFAKPPLHFLNQIITAKQLRTWQPDVVHQTYYSNNHLISKKVPRVITVYDMIHERFPEQFNLSDQTAKNKKRAIENANYIICISDSTRRDLINILSTPPNKICTIHLAYEHFFTPFSEENILIKLTNRPFILYVGQRGNYKNFLRLLIAVGHSSRIRNDFDIVCFGGGKFLLHELDLIVKLGMRDRVIQISGDDLFLGNLYRSAAVFAYPSQYEGFGLPPLEAMAHGCPVACSSSSSLPEVVGEAGEYFDPLDTDSIVRALETVLYTTGRREELIHLGQQRLALFSWKKCAEQTLNVYEQFR